MTKKYILIFSLAIISSHCFASEVLRQRGLATYLVFPIVDSTGTYCTGVAGLDSEKSVWGDAGIPGAFVDCTNEATEIGTTGIYSLSLTAAECTTDYMMIQVKGTNVLTQGLLINFKPYSVLTGGLVGGVTVYQNLDKTGYTASTVSDKTGYQLVGGVTVYANNDKAGYTASTVSDKTGYQLVGGVTVYANNDKTGYTASTVSDKTGYSIDNGTVTALSGRAPQDVWDYNISAYQFDGKAGGYLVNSATNTTAIVFNDFTLADIWGYTQRELTGYVTSYTLVTNQDKTGYKATLTENVTAYTLLYNADKTGYTATLTEYVTSYTLLNNQDKNGYKLGEYTTAYALIEEITAGASAAEVWAYTSRGLTEQVTAYALVEDVSTSSSSIKNAVWNAQTSEYSGNTGTYGKKVYDLPESGTGDWSVTEKAMIKSALSIEGSTPSVNMNRLQQLIKTR